MFRLAAGVAAAKLCRNSKTGDIIGIVPRRYRPVGRGMDSPRSASPFTNRDFRLLFGGSSISMVGEDRKSVV